MEQDFLHTAKGKAKTAGGALADFFLPRYCLVCGRRLGIHERYLCIFCLGDMPLTRNWDFLHNSMADRFNGFLIRTEKEDRENSYQYAAALFFYQEHNNYRRITQALKYKGNIAAGKHFGRMLGRKLAASWGKEADLVVPVPLHWSRKLSRGYNQAGIIASSIAGVLGIPMIPDLLIRTRKTATQTKLSVQDKEKNVEGAFRVNRKYARKVMKYKHIILVDDVFTTGATVSSCYFALRERFPVPVRISAATLACVQKQ